MNKTFVEFYQIEFIFDPQVSVNELNKTEDQLKSSYWENLLSKIDLSPNNSIIYNDENNFIEIMDKTTDYIFGIIGISKSIKRSVLQRIKDSEGNFIDKTDFDIQNYKYFVLRRSDFRFSVIKNSTVRAFTQPFAKMLNQYKINNKNNILITPVKDTNIKTKLKNIQNLLEFNLVFSNESSSLGLAFEGLSSLFNISQNKLSKLSVKLDFKEDTLPTEEFKKITLNENLLESDYEKFQIKGTSDDVKETIELVKGLLVKSIDLNLSSEALENDTKYLDEIKKALLESF